MIIVLPPSFGHHLRFGQAMKSFDIETFAPEGAIETLIAPILPGFAGGNPSGRDAKKPSDSRQGPLGFARILRFTRLPEILAQGQQRFLIKPRVFRGSLY